MITRKKVLVVATTLIIMLLAYNFLAIIFVIPGHCMYEVRDQKAIALKGPGNLYKLLPVLSEYWVLISKFSLSSW
jgi:hypothetical protein